MRVLARLFASSNNSLDRSFAGQSGTKVSFFMRKGADCLSKWVGEAERQLRLLFDQARLLQPSIIFFDEIDGASPFTTSPPLLLTIQFAGVDAGLAPVRSSKQDQIHSSIVSTLLALMDGLDNRGTFPASSSPSSSWLLASALCERELYR